MSKPTTILILFFISFNLNSLYSQPWLSLIPKDKSKTTKINFYDIQKAFNKYWEGKNLNEKTVTKGKGYKPFKRWETWMEPRVFPNGNFPVNQTWVEYQKEKKNYQLKAVPVSNWVSVGPVNVPLDQEGKPSGIGRINCVAFHPGNPDIIYTGSPSGGFWKSTNGGISWITTNDELPSIGISDIAINPKNPSIIYIATGDGDASDTYSIGILKSVDGGLSWNTTGLSLTTSDNRTIRKILINPLKPDTIIAASSAGIFWSGNAGVNWTQVQSGNFKDLEFKSGNPDIIFAARYGTLNARFYKSINGGLSFTEILTEVDLSETRRLELAVGGLTASDVIYALYSKSDDDGFHSLWKSVDEGITWTKVYDKSSSNLLGWTYDGTDSGGQGWYDLSLIVSPLNAQEVYVGGVNIWKSVDSGTNWKIIGHWSGNHAPYVHADHHYLIYSPAGTLFNGNDGGLYKSQNGGLTWTDISNSLKILQIDRIGVSQSNPDVVIVGNQDNGTMKFNAKTNTWTQILGGDGCECIVDYNNDQTIYTSYIKGDLRRSDNGGTKFISIQPEGSGTGAWHTPFVMDVTDSRILYAGYVDVWKTWDKGTNWKKISSNLAVGEPLRQIAVAASDTNFIYVTNGSHLWKTINGGVNWTELPKTELNGLFITYIAVDNKNPNKLWVSVSGYSTGKKVFYSEDAGSSWSGFSENLPNVPVNCIIREENSNDVIYVGTDIGVYYRDAAMNKWERFSTGLPNVEVSELEIQYNTARLVAGTRGRGLYQTPITLSGSFENLLTQCFTGTAIPTGWGFEIVKNKNGKIPAIDFISTSENPTGFVAKKCSNFARFNSFTCEVGDRLRFRMTNPLSAINLDSARLTFQMTQDNEYPDRSDTIITQWSVNGTSWNNIDTLTRYNAENDKWIKVINTLPKGAKNQANLYIAFEFVSAYGNDIHIDDINIEKINPEAPRFVSAQTNETGNQVEIKFNKEMTDPAGNQNEFSVLNGTNLIPVTIHLKAGDKFSYQLELPSSIKYDSNVKISYTKGTITSIQGGKLESFVNKLVTNKVKNPDGIETLSPNSVATVFPNPNSGEFEIKFKENFKDKVEFEIYGMNGKLVYSNSIGRIFKNQSYRININKKAKGIYKILIKSGSKKYMGNIVFQ